MVSTSATGAGSQAIGFVGLATSHPYTDADTVVARHPDASLHVWEPDEDRLVAFLERNPGARSYESLAALIDADVHGFVITMRPPDVSDVVLACVATGVPLFINKPAAATLKQLDALDRVVQPIAERVLSSSVLRFANPVREFAAGFTRTEVLTARATVRHDVGRWLHGSTDWQDDPDTGGGGIVTIGLHGLELLASLLGVDFEIISSMAQVRRLQGLRSEDTAVIAVRWADGILGTIDVVGVAASESYGVSLETVNGPISLELPAADTDPFGYRGAIDAFLEMVDAAREGRRVASPVAWHETRAILRGIVTASALAHRVAN
ncbi:Gfo/Idh/MocA family oxidoreductase [Microbacterium sp.]|uniref:Gfo/Idh/MocA family protein n=1 Tax=Microbacterium sp. TaxID=51671 RepID=UPI0027349027|nr:Gfo/Idh/MocA family oxidoreductase [Microbacterium sp.]MDP3951403.1 Gfo/Idh/MocA family oxidoreductase [Microbacterium sp.]